MHPMFDSLPPAFAFVPGLKGAPYGVALLQGDSHRVLWANAACQTIFGEPLLVGCELLEMFPHLKQSALAKELRQALMLQQPTFLSHARLWSSSLSSQPKSERLLQLSILPWQHAEPQDHGVLLIVIDRLEDFAAKARAERSEERLQALIESLPHEVYMTDETGCVLYANQRWQTYTGMTPGEMNKSAWYALVHPDDQSAMWLQWNKRLELRRFEICARIREHQTQQYRWQQIVGLPFLHDVSGASHWIGTWTDLTSRVQQEEHQNDLRLRFVSTVSHDLRGPLTAIRTGAESITRSTQDEKLKAKLDRILRTVDRTNDMLEDLLNINVLQHDGLPRAEFAETDLNSAMQLSIANFNATYDNRLQVDMPPDVRGTWHAATLVRAIDNLIGNAFKYGDHDAPVTLKVVQQDRHVQIDVHNVGRVLGADEQQRIFMPYERLHETEGGRPQPRGWGLGLSFVADVARAHGGTVSVQSKQEGGTTFQLRIPNVGVMRAQGNVSTHAEGETEATRDALSIDEPITTWSNQK